MFNFLTVKYLVKYLTPFGFKGETKVTMTFASKDEISRYVLANLPKGSKITNIKPLN